MSKDSGGKATSIEERSVHEAEWAAAMDSSEDAIYILGLDRRLVRANRAFFRLTGTRPETAIGMHIEDIVHPEGEEVPCPVCRAQEELRDAVIVMEADHPDNPADVPLEITVKIVRDQDGRPLSILMTLHDLTEGRRRVEEQRRLEQRLRQAQRLESIGRLARGIAHDFNNILTAILGYSELLLLELPEGSQQREMVEVICKAGRRARALISQLLAFSRRQVLNLQPIELHPFIETCFKMISKMLGEDIVVEMALEAHEPIITGDPAQIEQVFMNLAVNARDAMPQGGRLRIETADFDPDEDFLSSHPHVGPGPLIRITVSDTGVGIPPEHIEKIFDPFFTTKEEGEGTGLGLATVHGTVEQHGGCIGVTSTPGQGTRFDIYLPSSSQPRIQQEGDTEAMGPHLPMGDETLLVVDDEPTIRKMAIDALSRLGYDCLEAESGEAALAMISKRTEEIKLLITDVIMPVMDGMELARRAWDLVPDLEVLFISGYSRDYIGRDHFLKPGVNLLSKPFTPSALAAKVREILDRGRE